MKLTFNGYVRSDGSVGTRNYIGIVPTVICSSIVVKEISEYISNAVPFIHANGCAQLGDDLKLTKTMLVGAIINPNLYATLLVGLGCETNQLGTLMNNIPNIKPLESVEIQELHGMDNTVKKGVEIVSEWSEKANRLERKSISISKLTVGVINVDLDMNELKEIGPVLSKTVDILIKNNAKVIVGLSANLRSIGDILAKRTYNSLIKQKLIDMSKGLQRLQWGREPSETLTKKILYEEEQINVARLEKQITGTSPICGLLSYGEIPKEAGLYLMDTTNNVVESLSKMTSSGCNIIILLSKRGVLSGVKSVPSVIVSPKNNDGNFNDLIDHYIHGSDITKEAEDLINKITVIASGKRTQLENFDLGEFSIPHLGTTY